MRSLIRFFVRSKPSPRTCDELSAKGDKRYRYEQHANMCDVVLATLREQLIG